MALQAGDAVWLAAARGARFKHAKAFVRRDAMGCREDEILSDRRASTAGAMSADNHDDMAGQRLVGRPRTADQARGGRHENKQSGEEGERTGHRADDGAVHGATTAEPSLPAASMIQSR